MTSLVPITIGGYEGGGLRTDRKPFLLAEEAFTDLENAYVFRGRVKKREGQKMISEYPERSRLRRILATVIIPEVTPAGVVTMTIANLFTSLGVVGEFPELQKGSVYIDVSGADTATFDDDGDGTFTCTGNGNATGSYVDYTTGVVVLNFTAATAGGGVLTVWANYFPCLPVMGMFLRELSAVNAEQTLFFDTKYCYKWIVTGFEELDPTTTWSGSDAEFFYAINYKLPSSDVRRFFVTNFNIADPIRYYANPPGTWTTFAPLVSTTDSIFQARLMCNFYGRLLLFNTWEGNTAAGPLVSTHFPNRCRFSIVGDATAADAFRTDIFGKGGYIDAPVAENVVSLAFYKNQLIVGFEKSTWQLTYRGEYGLPFLWERISSDFGCESSFSTIIMDEGTIWVGDKAITASTGIDVKRIDQEIPQFVFDDIRNAQNGPERVHGVRDFYKELLLWTYPDANYQRKFPNRTLVFNYANKTWARFRDNVTCFGVLQPSESITWSRDDIYWDDDSVFWSGSMQQINFPAIVSGNQQGWVHYYQATSWDEPSMAVTGCTWNSGVAPALSLYIKNHNMENGDIIYLTSMMFLDGATFAPLDPTLIDINDKLYQVTRIDDDNITLDRWDATANVYVDDFTVAMPVGSVYVGGGVASLKHKLVVTTKDFNPFASTGMQVKVSYIDFLFDSNPTTACTIELFLNSALAVKGNLLTGNQDVETYDVTPYYTPLSQYAWHRFFATSTGQFIRIRVTYDDALMNQIVTHQSSWELNAMQMWAKPGGRNVF